jgi:hypothetical protein
VPESLFAVERLLVSQIRALQRAHRSGISEQFGQIEQLFETADRLEEQLDAKPSPAKPRCFMLTCGRSPIGGEIRWSTLCQSCAGKAIAGALADGTFQPPPLAMRS